jgi:hypothetical protein
MLHLFVGQARLFHREVRLMKTLGIAALAMIALALAPVANAQLANPGFESPITADGPPFVGFWEGFSGAATATAATSTVMPRTGAQHLALSIVNTNDTFTGVFQDVPGLTPGNAFSFSGWHKRTTTPLDLDAEIRIEWRNSVTDMEVGRTPNTVPVIGTDYAQFTVSAPVPAGANTARVVYAIQTFSGGPTNNGTVFLDDMSVVIPEPGSALLAVCSLIGLAGAARRR